MTSEQVGKIICGHNVDVLRGTIDSDSIDLTVTSPPYDDLRLYKGFEFDFAGIASELYRVTKPGGVVVWVVGDAVQNKSESCTSFKQALHFVSLGFKLHDTMIYEKATSSFPAGPRDNRYTQIFEYMFVLSKGTKPKTANLIGDKPNAMAGKIKTAPWVGRKNDLLTEVSKPFITAEFGIRTNIWRFAVGQSKDMLAARQPAILPDRLALDHILSWSNPGDIVLDPFSGSGTTCLMAKEAKREFIGVEVCEEYCEIARQRMSYAVDIVDATEKLSSSDFEALLL